MAKGYTIFYKVDSNENIVEAINNIVEGIKQSFKSLNIPVDINVSERKRKSGLTLVINLQSKIM
jgi:hypothetical protein